MAKQQPIKDFRLGLIKAAVWANETKYGIRCNTTFARLYRDGDEWNESAAFGRDDLPLVAKLANRAHDFIFGLQQNPGHDSDSAQPDEDGPADDDGDTPGADAGTEAETDESFIG